MTTNARYCRRYRLCLFIGRFNHWQWIAAIAAAPWIIAGIVVFGPIAV